jgi:hypothetical protein
MGCKSISLFPANSPTKVAVENFPTFPAFVPCKLGGIFGPKRDDGTGEWRNPHVEEHNDLYCSPNIVWVIKSRRMRWAGHVTRMGEMRILGLGGETWEKEAPDVDGRIILRWIFKKWDVESWTGLICLMLGTGSGLL